MSDNDVLQLSCVHASVCVCVCVRVAKLLSNEKKIQRGDRETRSKKGRRRRQGLLLIWSLITEGPRAPGPWDRYS